MTEIHAPSFFYPEGKTGVLFIHGFTASPQEMQPLALHLRQQGFTCLGVRLAGHGTNEQDLLSTSWRDWYESALQGLCELEKHCESIFVVGLSMGGLLATLLARDYPQRICGLSLLGPAFYPNSRFLFMAPWLRFFIKAIHKGEASKKYIDGHGLFSYPSMPLPALAQLYQLIKEARRAWPHITRPTQITMGKHDHTVKPSSAIDLFNRLGSTAKDLVYLSNSGHILTVEPDAPCLFAAVFKFLNSR